MVWVRLFVYVRLNPKSFLCLFWCILITWRFQDRLDFCYGNYWSYTSEYQIKGKVYNEDDEAEFAKYLQKLGFGLINEDDLRGVDFDDKEEMRTYITDKIFANDENKDVARKMSGKDAGSNQKETAQERVARILNQQNTTK